MPRYFIQVAYKGTNYAGFQIQKNANSIQSEIEKAMKILFRNEFSLTGSSRTDAGVHSNSNYFHFDAEVAFDNTLLQKSIYNLNAILPKDIVLINIFPVSNIAHCRFDALSREYEYHVYQSKNPFLSDTAYFYPYSLNLGLLNQAAQIITQFSDFKSFSKRNTQVKTFNCNILHSYWEITNTSIVYQVKGNRFLRGMVRGLVGTMLRVGTKRITLQQFLDIIEAKDCSKADFSVPPQGLFLKNVHFPSSLIISLD